MIKDKTYPTGLQKLFPSPETINKDEADRLCQQELIAARDAITKAQLQSHVAGHSSEMLAAITEARQSILYALSLYQ